MLAGPSVIPAVRAFLFRRERSGIYQPRRWAVDVLAALHAYGVLEDYLKRPRIAADPVERAGDEAVANAAARALSRVREEWVFRLMLDLAEWHLTSGVVEALGSFNRMCRDRTGRIGPRLHERPAPLEKVRAPLFDVDPQHPVLRPARLDTKQQHLAVAIDTRRLTCSTNLTVSPFDFPVVHVFPRSSSFCPPFWRWYVKG
jgi:hypothetical protein